MGVLAVMGSADSQSAAVAHVLKVTGPVTGGKHGVPFGSYFGDLSTYNYVEREYFIEGEAARYHPLGPLNSDGRWDVEPIDSRPYKTRILVRRPKDAAKFNGTVLVEWTNVSGGFDVAAADTAEVYDGGFAYVAVSAQSVGVHGFPNNPSGLVQWDPERYGSLSVPGNSISYDIYSQAGRALRDPKARTGIDPLDGLQVTKLIAVGSSQSAARLITYANAIQPRDHVYDAIMPLIGAGSGSGFDDTILDPSKIATMTPDEISRIRGTQTRIRDDLNVPVMFVNSECETLAYVPSRQADTARFRMWEVAGASHGPKAQVEAAMAKATRDFGTASSAASPLATSGLISTVMWSPVADAALLHVGRWIRGGAAPPQQQPIVLEGGKIARDPLGNAKGGVRLPDLEVPTAAYDGGGYGPGTSGLYGRSKPFSHDQLKQLYPTHEDYVGRVKAAAAAAERSGVIRQDRAVSYVKEAQTAEVP
jgi:Alpha/beta hydrolase domain